MKSCDECERKYYAKGKCVKHYFKARRKTTRKLIDPNAVCIEEGCTRKVRCRDRCSTHYNAFMGYQPKPKARGRGRGKKEMIGYRAAHLRVEAVKGKAKTHSCVDCGGQARDWSLDPNAVHTYEDGDKVWSMNIEDYAPRCIPCHRDLDGGYAWHEYRD